MPPARGQKRKSDQLTASTSQDVAPPENAMQKVATKTGDETEGSPSKRQRTGLTMARKQQLIDNLQTEIADRARKLRANYNEHIRHLRFRIENRANRIPPSLLKMKMGDLLAKRTAEEQQKAAPPPAGAARPPPVPPKDVIVGRPALQRTGQGAASAAPPVRTAKRTSEDISGGDKENEMAHIDNPKKKPRADPARATRPPPNPSQVLSPTSSNSRVLPPRERAQAAPSPARSFIARPVSPVKPATSNSGMFSSMVEKARSTRAAATTRKTTTSSTASSAAGSTAAASTRARKPTAAAAAAASRAGATSRATRRVSAISESSDGSTGTVVRKRTTAAPAAAAPAAKRTVMGTIRKGVTGGASKKAPAAKPAPAAASTGRVLRKRN